MEKMAMRIRARAIRRCGELLKEVETKQGARTDLEPITDSGNKLSERKQAGRLARFFLSLKLRLVGVRNVN